MLLHGEVHNDRLRVVLLRAPTVVASGGYVYLHPTLSGRSGNRPRPAGFDPIQALISDKDVARAIQAAIHARGPGIYNVAGNEALPLSTLAQWTGHTTWAVPGPLLALLTTGARFAGQALDAALDAPISAWLPLDTARRASSLPPARSHRPGARGRRLLSLETAAGPRVVSPCSLGHACEHVWFPAVTLTGLACWTRRARASRARDGLPAAGVRLHAGGTRSRARSTSRRQATPTRALGRCVRRGAGLRVDMRAAWEDVTGIMLALGTHRPAAQLEPCRPPPGSCSPSACGGAVPTPRCSSRSSPGSPRSR
jgi:hypothetical protein